MTSTQKTSFLDPKSIIRQLDIKKDEVIAFLGSGSGYFAIEIAKLIGREGYIYAIDILKNKIDSFESLSRTNQIFNYSTHQINIENQTKLEAIFKNRKPDKIFLVSVLSENKQKAPVIKNSTAVLKPGGKIIIIEWKNKNLKIVPPKNMLVDKEKLKSYLKWLNLKFKKELDAGRYHWGFVFTK
ncbi:MAG: methyltransferase domain-containing protein [Candidatus Moranbacteria bacterium]|nr:methyltransferase domain-containing protein [Candidatus Moranbacteria bacterium]